MRQKLKSLYPDQGFFLLVALGAFLLIQWVSTLVVEAEPEPATTDGERAALVAAGPLVESPLSNDRVSGSVLPD